MYYFFNFGLYKTIFPLYIIVEPANTTVFGKEPHTVYFKMEAAQRNLETKWTAKEKAEFIAKEKGIKAQEFSTKKEFETFFKTI
jgi:hypothetical protein